MTCHDDSVLLSIFSDSFFLNLKGYRLAKV